MDAVERIKRAGAGPLRTKVSSQPAEIKADASKRQVELWIARYGNVDLDNDVMEYGCAKQSIAEDLPKGLIKFFWQHDVPLGPVIALEEHREGILMVGKVSNHPSLDVYLEQCSDGTAQHGSIRFWVRDFEAGSEGEKRVTRIKDIRIREGSAVIWPANEDTSIVSVQKSMFDFAEGVGYLARLRHMVEHSYYHMTPEEATEAAALLEQMTSEVEAAKSLLAGRTKSDEAIEAVIKAARARREMIERMAKQ